MTGELLPCPMTDCESMAIVVVKCDVPNFDSWTVRCDGCGSQLRFAYEKPWTTDDPTEDGWYKVEYSGDFADETCHTLWFWDGTCFEGKGAHYMVRRSLHPIDTEPPKGDENAG